MPGELLTEKPASAADSEASGGEEQAADGAEQKTTKPEAPASKAVVGIIYPPPEVRSIHSYLLYLQIQCLYVAERASLVVILNKAHLCIHSHVAHSSSLLSRYRVVYIIGKK